MALASAKLFAVIFAACASAAWASNATPEPLIVVNLTHPADSDPMHVAVFAAAGLENRDGDKVYVLRDDDGTSGGALAPAYKSRTQFWLDELLVAKRSIVHMTPHEFLNSKVPRHGVIRYASGESGSFTAVLTLAGVYSAIPLDQTLSAMFPAAAVKFDTVGKWKSEEDAIKAVAPMALQNTTALAVNGLNDLQAGKLVDWIVHQKIFVMGLKNMCIPLTNDHSIFKDILAKSPWSLPVKVYGYNHMSPLSGLAVYEAETNCADVLSAVVSGGTANMPFWAQFEPLAPKEQMVQPKHEPLDYNASKTYVALLMSDMDNFDFVQGDGFRAMQQRADLCSKDSSSPCFPLTWTMQPALATLSPALLRWYFDKLNAIGSDSFVLPPSGALYSYPSSFRSDLQPKYVELTNEAGRILNTSGSAHWEFFGSWLKAMTEYFPRYEPGADGVKLFMLDQVPYMFPLPALGFDNVKVIGDPSSPNSVVLVRPSFSVASGGTWDDQKKHPPSNIASKLSSLSRGDVTYVYCITGTSAPQAAIKEMVGLLAGHVEVVGYEQLATLGRQRELHKKRGIIV